MVILENVKCRQVESGGKYSQREIYGATLPNVQAAWGSSTATKAGCCGVGSWQRASACPAAMHPPRQSRLHMLVCSAAGVGHPANKSQGAMGINSQT